MDLEALLLYKNSFFRHLDLHSVKPSHQLWAKRLAIFAMAHDRATAAHNYRVSRLSTFLAQKHGLSRRAVKKIRTFTPLHDIGKIFLDREVLNKREALTREEYERVQQHTLFSTELLKDPYLVVARNIALYHHERYDGSGYPFGLRGEEIPIEAQIVALADVFDALRTTRSYKRSFTAGEVLDTITADEGRVNRHHFNPLLLLTLTRHIETIGKMIYKGVV